MEALIGSESYSDKDILNKEQNKLFNRIWHFVGFNDDFLNENDFISINIASIPVVIQKLRGEIRAFKNVCSHRHSIIQTEAKGNRPLMCPYHGWAYDNKGVPRGIPKKPLFSFTESELLCLKLEEFSIQLCGRLVFVNISSHPQNLNSYLGSYFGRLELMSENFGKRIDVNSMIIDANWKILVENTLESYHVNLVHANSFKKLGTDGLDFQFDNGPINL